MLVSLKQGVAALLAVWALCGARTDAALNPIIVRGNKMFDAKTGERFLMKGLTYEYAVSDKYYTQYSRDAIATNLKGLKFNTIRIYNINPDESYALFMKDMDALGVYVMPAASPDNSPYFGKYRYAPIRKDLGPEGPVSTAKNGVKTSDNGETCYPALLLEYGKKIIKNFAQYDNTLGIIIANEILQIDLTPAACLKQYAADLKNWMRANANNMRIIPLAYAAADSAYDNPKISSIRLIPEDYHVIKLQGLLCGDVMKDGMMTRSIDIYLINEYRWCENADYESTYRLFLEVAKGLPIVIGFGEFGCWKPEGSTRSWKMVPYMLQEPASTEGFSNVFSGGIAYSYGEAKLDKGSRFPMFTGGSLDPLETPSYKPTPDYANLKKVYDKYQPYKELAAWSSDSKCKWAPTVTEKISATNKYATKNGWILDSCNVKDLKLADTDTWITKSRDGIVCDDQGGRCDVSVTSKIGTTQADICGAVVEVEKGGAKCSGASDCGQNGQCMEVNGEKQCLCLPCWKGMDCKIKDIVSCSKLSSSKDAPKFIFVGIGAFIGVMFVVFVALGVVAQKKKRAIDKLGDQVKLRAPGTTGATQAGASL
ncbi:hypothetical protein PINS_up000197 [Pythium insidiosum]|nr:hypothetical protein PINS_up000197 [Pythium insidiosum]